MFNNFTNHDKQSQSKDDIIFVGADPGNVALKLAFFRGDNLYMRYIPNTNGPGINLTETPTGPDEKCLAVKVLSSENDSFRNQVHFIGDLAKRQLQADAEQDRDRNKVSSDSVNLITPAALGLFGNEKLVLCMGATSSDYEQQAPLLQKKMTGKHKIYYQYGSFAGQVVEPEVLATYTYAQAVAGLFGLLYTKRVSSNDWKNSTVMALDFGHGQLSVAVLENLDVVRRACFSLDFGFYQIAEAVQDYLNKAPYYVTATIPELQDVVEKGYYLKHGKEISVREIIDTATNNLMETAYREIRAKITKVSQKLYDQISTIVVMGGGGETMAPVVGSKYGISPLIAPDAVYINAIGLAWMAKRKWEKEHAG